MLTDDTNSARHPRKCTAHSKRSGDLCRRWAMRAQGVCAITEARHHLPWPKAQAAIERADLRLRGLAIPAVDALERLLKADSEAAILGAAKDALDRAGLKVKDQIELDTTITVTRPW